jgi:hypothetical protein
LLSLTRHVFGSDVGGSKYTSETSPSPCTLHSLFSFPVQRRLGRSYSSIFISIYLDNLFLQLGLQEKKSNTERWRMCGSRCSTRLGSGRLASDVDAAGSDRACGFKLVHIGTRSVTWRAETSRLLQPSLENLCIALIVFSNPLQ